MTEQLDTMVEEFQNQPRQRESNDQGSDSNQEQDDGESDPSNRDEPPEDSGPQEQLFEVGTPFNIRSLQVQPPDRRARTSGGRRANTISGTPTGSGTLPSLATFGLFGATLALALPATARIFRHFLRDDQPTFRAAYLVLCAAGSVAPMLPQAAAAIGAIA